MHSHDPLQQTPLEQLSHEMIRHGKLLHRMRQQLSASTPFGLDFAAFALLMTLVKGGPQRQRELALDAHLDPSTVSRHVGQLVSAGLVERRPDPADGRAAQLIASEQGMTYAKDFLAARHRAVGEVMAGWQDDDVQALVRLLTRLNDGMENRCSTTKSAIDLATRQEN